MRYHLRDTSVPDNNGGKIHIYDNRGAGTREPVAVVPDIETAVRIVGLLNADERLKDQARIKLTAVK